MVNPVTSLTSNGLRDWLIQRASAVVLMTYIAWLLVCALWASPLNFSSWHAIFACSFTKIFTVLALLSLVLHAWIGMWTILTDYVKPKWFQLPLMISIIVALFGYGIWGILIVWGV